MDSTNALLQKAQVLAKRVEQQKAERDRAVAKYEMCMEELSKTFGVSTIEDAETLLTKLRSELGTMEASLEQSVSDVENCLTSHGA